MILAFRVVSCLYQATQKYRLLMMADRLEMG